MEISTKDFKRITAYKTECPNCRCIIITKEDPIKILSRKDPQDPFSNSIECNSCRSIIGIEK